MDRRKQAWKRIFGPSSLLGGRSRGAVALRGVPLLAIGAGAVVTAHLWQPGASSETTAEPIPVVEAPVELPMEMNARVERWMGRFLTDQRKSFEIYLTRRGIYRKMIQEELRSRDMPEDLLYLAMIESGFSPRATSHASAAGVWQFMGPTAKQYGLRVDGWVDERRDPVKATGAALDYLQWLHGRYDSWYLAAAAYNAGPGRVDRILRRYAEGRKGDEDIYWEIIDHLPRETREYVPKLLAATTLAREAHLHDFEVGPSSAYEFDRVFVPGSTPLTGIARALGVEPRLMRELNPHLIRGVTPPGASYALRVPVGASPQVVASLGNGSGTRLADD